jgi:putative acetyltransferase
VSGVEVRPERRGDRAAVRRVNEVAFGQPDEADLVDRLREQAAAYLGLVAVRAGEVIGHVAFSPMTMAPPRPHLVAWGLAPMAVLPAYQRQGVGGRLVREGLAACRREGGTAVFVLGHPAYYPRFGFAPASAHGLRSTYDVPAEAFMVLELVPGALGGVMGTAHYDPVFAE